MSNSTMKDAFVIGDIAGNFKTLMALLENAGALANNIVSVGDIVDRGPRSKEVVEFFRARQKATAVAEQWLNGPQTVVLKGNHEDMMVESNRNKYTVTSPGDWEYNGGTHTLKSFDGKVPADVIDWLAGLPLYLELTLGEEGAEKKYLISHAFAFNPDKLPTAESSDKEKGRFLWNRSTPATSSKYALQICGHNSQFGMKAFGNPAYAQCIDTSNADVLTGIHLPSMTVFQQEYIDD